MATDYGLRLRQARKHAGLTQEELSKRTGIPQSTISTAERMGSGSSDTPTYAKACGVDAHWLATGDGSMLVTPGEMTGKATFSKRSAQATELAALFDLIPETNLIGRAKAYTKASQAILDELPATAPVSQSHEKQSV